MYINTVCVCVCVLAGMHICVHPRNIHFSAPFLVHMETVFKEVTKILDNPASDIRKAAVGALAQFCICVANVAKETKAVEAQTGSI